MLIERHAVPEDIPALTALWQEAFGDTPEQIGLFFRHGFAPERSLVLEDGEILSGLYWFDCSLGGEKLAYIYAVATLRRCRGRGLARRLLESAHSLLAARGYAAAVLVPGSRELFDYYRRQGYRVCSAVAEKCVRAQGLTSLEPISPEDYALARRALLPPGGVLQEGDNLRYMAAQTAFYRGSGCILAASVSDGKLTCLELLGTCDSLEGVAAALGAREGFFRMPGSGRDFAMALPLQQEKNVTIGYFGWAFD